ncbi:MAG: CDP-alcohol phosphatidyltransferase family protein [Thermoanaerobaculia bacterium]
MIRALALVAPRGPGAEKRAADRDVPPETPLLGLPLIRRTVLAARRAGFTSVSVVAATPGIRAALEGAAVEMTEMPTDTPPDALVLPWNVVVSVRDLETLRAGASEAGVAVHSRPDLGRAERHLLASLVKDTEGFMSRHFERKISLAVSRRLAATSVSPNAMTLVSVAIGLAGAVFFLQPTARSETIGALLFLLHSILDGCDGELARLRLQESRWGGLLDFWGDNVVHSAVFAAMAIGWARLEGHLWPLVLGAAAVGGTIASALFVHLRTMSKTKEGPLYTSVATEGETRLSRVADAVSRRDFIYLVLILSAFGKARWFLVLAAVGAPMYFFVLTAIALAERSRYAPRSGS